MYVILNLDFEMEAVSLYHVSLLRITYSVFFTCEPLKTHLKGEKGHAEMQEAEPSRFITHYHQRLCHGGEARVKTGQVFQQAYFIIGRAHWSAEGKGHETIW